MGVIYHHREWLAFVDTLEAAGHGTQLRDATGHDFRLDSQAQAGARGRQDVVHVDPADERGGHLEAQIAILHLETRSLKTGRDVPRANTGAGAKTIPERLGPRSGLDAAAILIVTIDDGEARRGRSLEKHLLGGKVLVHSLMEIQVVAGEIGEDRGMEPQPVDPTQSEGVRGNLHHHMSTALRIQFGKQPVKIERLRSSVDGLEHTAGQMILDGADHGGRLSRRAQNGIHQMSGRGFAVGAGHAHQRQFLIEIPIKSARCQSEGPSAVLDLDPAAGQFRRRLRFADNRDSAPIQSILREAAAVGVAAGEGEEQIIATHTARIIFQAGDGSRGKLRRKS